MTWIDVSMRYGAEPELVDRVRQRVREKLFVDERMREYRGRGPLGGWIRVIATRTALDERRTDANCRRTSETCSADVRRSTAARWIHESRAAILEETRRRLRARLRASPSEVETP